MGEYFGALQRAIQEAIMTQSGVEYVDLTPEEVTTLRNSIVNNKVTILLAETLIEVFGDVTMLVEIRDGG